MNKRLRLPLALSLALGSSSVAALGLGQIEVKSALNQPLTAEIPVLSSQPGESDALVVRLAPPEALARVGMQTPTGVAANLEFAVDTNARGEKIIRVTTPGKVADPFVTFLLEVDWGAGKMLREYTILLDPPTMAPVRHTATAAPVSAPTVPSDAETVPLAEAPPPPEMHETPVPEPLAEAPPPSEPAPEPVAEPEPAPAAEQPAPEPAPSRTDNYGPVAEGETLWQIAQFARTDESVTMNQMMLALLYANPDAFIGQNVNRLKRGAVLRIPSKEESLAIAAAEAAEQVRAQSQAWRATPDTVMQPAEPLVDTTSSAAPVAAPPASTDSRLEVIPPRGDTPAVGGAQSGAAVAGEGREMRADLARSREQVSALTQENVDLKTRVGELEKISGDSQKLLELKDSELAAATQRLRELETQAAANAAAAATADAAPAPVADAAPPPPASETAIDPSVPPLVETPADVVTPATDGTTTAVTDTPAATDATAETPAPVETAPAPAQAEPAKATPAPMPERPPQAPIWTNPWVIGGIALVVVGLIALLLGRRRSAAAPAARYESGAVASSIAAVQANAPRHDTPEDDDHLDDLVAGVSRDPANLNRHLELVRYYYDANDAAGFENAAEAMYSRVYDPDDLAWKQVLAMGQEIAPEHPLFVQAEETDTVFEPAPIPPPPAIVPVPSASPAPPVREIDWGSPAPAADNASTQQMRIEDVRQSMNDPTPSFEPDLPDAFSYEPAPVDTSDAGSGFEDADAASTKLELARAYLDMGDVEGARGMLEEVVGEGNPGQRAEAKRLLDEIR